MGAVTPASVTSTTLNSNDSDIDVNQPAPTFALRPAAEHDVPVIAAIWHSGWQDGHLGFVPQELVAQRSKAPFLVRTPERMADTTVAVNDNSVAGFIMVVDDEVEQVYVANEFRGSGVAKLLMVEANRQMAVAGYETAWLAVIEGNARARAFYARQGWIDEGPVLYSAGTAMPGETVDVPVHRYTRAVVPNA